MRNWLSCGLWWLPGGRQAHQLQQSKYGLVQSFNPAASRSSWDGVEPVGGIMGTQFHRREDDKEPSWLVFVGIMLVSIVLNPVAFVRSIFRPISGIKCIKLPIEPNEAQEASTAEH